MPAPKPDRQEEDATSVPVPNEGARTGSPAAVEQQVQSSSASAPFLAPVPAQQVNVQGPVSSQQLVDHERSRMNEQSRVRGDRPERIPSPPPQTMFESWSMTALRSLRLRRKRLQEQTQQVEQNTRVQQVPLVQDVPMEEAEPESQDSRSMRACAGSESDVTLDLMGNADASGTSVSNKMTSTGEPVGKRAKTERTESEAGSVVPEPAAVPETLQPAAVPDNTPLVPAPPVQVQSEPSPSSYSRRRAETTSSSTRYRERTYGCPCCRQTFKSMNLRYIHIGLEHSLILPRIGGEVQDNPDPAKLYLIPALSPSSMARGNGAYAAWNNTTAFNAYQSVVRNALNLSTADQESVTTRRWGTRIVPPKDTPPSHMDLPPIAQRAEFSGTNAILLCYTNRVIEHRDVQERGSRASEDARRARYQREKEEWIAKHQDRFQSFPSASHGSSERSQSYTPYKWENESHGQWNRSWEARGWRERPYHSNITWRAEEQSEQSQEVNEGRHDVVRQVQGTSVPVKAAPKVRSNAPVPPVVPPKDARTEVPVPVQTHVHHAHEGLDTDEVLAMAISASEAGQSQVTLTQAEQVQDIYARSFSDPNMTAEQIMNEVLNLQNTIPVDLFYRLLDLLEIDPATMPTHPAIQHMEDDDTVYVQNKIVDSETVPVTPVKPAAKVPKAPPPVLPENRTPPVQAAAGHTVTESQVQHVPATPKAALNENVQTEEDKEKAKPPTALFNVHTVSSIEPGTPPPPVPAQVVIDDGVDNRPAVPAFLVPNADQAVDNYVKQPRTWNQMSVQGPSVPGSSSQCTTTPISQTEWNLSQWPDLPQQAALVTGQVLQILMNMAKNQESRISATEQLVRNQFEILSSTPGGQLLPHTVPALLEHAVQHRDMLEQIAAERAAQQSQEGGSTVTAIEAYQQLSACHDQIIDEHEKLEARIAEMEKRFATLLEAQFKMSKKMEEMQKVQNDDRAKLIQTNKRFADQIQQHESTIILLNNHLDRTVQRLQELEDKFNRVVGERSNPSEDDDTLVVDMNTVQSNLRVIFAKMAITEEELDGSQVREAHRDQRLLGLMQDLSSRVTTTENYTFNLNEVMHAMQAVHADPGFPDLPEITHGYWGFVVPAERPPNWTVQDRTPNHGVITTISDSLQQYNPNLVNNTNYDIAGAFAPAVQAQGNVVTAPVPVPPVQPVPTVPGLLVGGALNCDFVAAGENVVPAQVQEEQQEGHHGASSHD